MAQRLTDLRRRLKVAERLLTESEERLVAALDAEAPPEAVDALEAERDQLERRARRLTAQVTEEAEVETLQRATRTVTYALAVALAGKPWARLHRRLHERTAPMGRSACLHLPLLADSVGELSRLRDRLTDTIAQASPAGAHGDQARAALRAEAAPLAVLLRRIYRLSPGDAPDLDALAALAPDSMPTVSTPPPSVPAPPSPPTDARRLQQQLESLREHLRLIEERKAEYILQTDIPLQLTHEERRIRTEIAQLEQQLGTADGR